MNNINGIDPLRDSQGLSKYGNVQETDGTKPSFKETLGTFLKDVNSMQVKADDSIQKMAAGEITDVHQVMNSVQEANVAFNMMMEIRNKVLDAYQEVMRMRL